MASSCVMERAFWTALMIALNSLLETFIRGTNNVLLYGYQTLGLNPV